MDKPASTRIPLAGGCYANIMTHADGRTAVYDETWSELFVLPVTPTIEWLKVLGPTLPREEP